MASAQEIKKLAEFWAGDYYTGVRGEQGIDDGFYRDVFDVPTLINPARVQRTGRASRLIDSPVEHIFTNNPIVTRKPLKGTNQSKLSALAISAETTRWLRLAKRANPNPLKQFPKNLLLRGEAWFQVSHNEKWVMGKKEREGSPIQVLTPEPMVVFGDPDREENGVPERVIIYYQASPASFLYRFPQWGNPKNRSLNDKVTLISALLYMDPDQIYFEIDGQTLKDQKNIYGCVPFVHALSGFGTSSPDGRPEELIVGRLRKSRDRLVRECAIVSDIDSTFHLFANRNIDVQPVDDSHEVPVGFQENYVMGKGLMHIIPYGINISRSDEMLPEPQLFQYYRDIVSEFEMEDPLVMSGAITGTSGRQQGMGLESALSRYETIIQNTEDALATALGIGLKICEKVPTLCPDEFGMTKIDIAKSYAVSLELRAEDPVATSTKATLGSRLYQQGEIDLFTNLTQYQGKSQSEAQEIMTNILVDKVTFNSPDVAELMGLKLAEKAGLLEDLEFLRQRRRQAETQQSSGLLPPASPSEMRQRAGEIETPLGQEMADMALTGRPARRAPAPFTRQQ
tara:strand:- start:1795 stop:3498 length:1704 start_codon:yes stop_codon:yes gene_type:complete